MAWIRATGTPKRSRIYIVENGVIKVPFTTVSGTPAYGTSGEYATITCGSVSTHVRTPADVDGSIYSKCVVEGYSLSPANSALHCTNQSEVSFPGSLSTIQSPTDPALTTNYAEVGLYATTVYIKNMYFE